MGTGSRSEKIKTYNYKDSRLSDHRSKTNFALDGVLAGDLDECIDTMVLLDQQEQLQVGVDHNISIQSAVPVLCGLALRTGHCDCSKSVQKRGGFWLHAGTCRRAGRSIMKHQRAETFAKIPLWGSVCSSCPCSSWWDLAPWLCSAAISTRKQCNRGVATFL